MYMLRYGSLPENEARKAVFQITKAEACLHPKGLCRGGNASLLQYITIN